MRFIGLNDFKDNVPVYQQVIDYIEDLISTHKIKEGERVPSVRELGEKLGVNPNTCVKAYDILIEEEIIETRRGTGSWVIEGAYGRIYARKKDEFTHKIIPLLVLTMKRYNIQRDQVIEVINDFYDDPHYDIP